MRRGVTEACTKWRGLVSEQSQSSAARQQEQNARRLFAQPDDRAIATQFSTWCVQFEDAEAPGPWHVDRMPTSTFLWAEETVALSVLPSGSSPPS